jgi:hypothetical protein
MNHMAHAAKQMYVGDFAGSSCTLTNVHICGRAWVQTT